MQGKFITIEGIEGVGKSTNIDFISSYLKSRNINLIVTREPGGTELAEKIRKILLDPQKEEVPEVGELLLFFAARSFHVNNVIQPALAEGKYVVCDRFTDATIAYQGSGRGFNVDRINLIANWVHKNIEPDMTILLDAPAEIGMERAKKRGSKDRMESEQMSFYRRVRKGYLNLAKNEPKRFAIIDATKSLIEVQKDITKHLENLVNE
ncbi:MAG TPA: dTMP kinase [Woeseiaceae bacterium]|nr:dTMP kinase [Woeseiaceae bacterium]|tara:strand:+ start:5090 stop:5713 length:624 start_codon:yes stop_codon:yes gene_type:complete